jgi:ATP-dependent DNA helicase RecG
VPRRWRKDFVLTVEDDSGFMHAVWFGQPFMKRCFKPGDRVMLSGPVSFFDRKQLQNPEWEVVTEEESRSLNMGRIVPIYPATAGLSQRLLRSLMRTALDSLLPLVSETLPDFILRREGFPGRGEAVAAMHFPETEAESDRARRRLAYEEALNLQLLLRSLKLEREQRRPGIAFPKDSPLARTIEAALPFRLTADQTRALEEITADMALPTPMGRLLQGDVGSGKTIVALLAACHAIEGGYQAAFMAPTEALADQHMATFERFAAPHGVRMVRLTGTTKGKARRTVLEEIADGTARIVVGTHALIQEGVAYHDLGLVVVDEQHRFGVFQRADLKSKGRTPDLLAMTATPIPRTLYLTKAADLSISFIREKPRGRGRIVTRVTDEGNREKVYEVLAREIDRGRQIFVVYPIIEESEKVDLKAATSMAAAIGKHPLFKAARVGLLHGRMKAPDKTMVLDSFRKGEIQILVTTTVIEVGIDIPNASVMVIEHPERFGLSQLHQLRGRIGRGEYRSYCILIEDAGAAGARERLHLFETTDDGFALAEADLRFRGSGSILGVRQHGPSGLDLKILDPMRDREILEKAYVEADRLSRENPELLGPDWASMRRDLRKGLESGRRFLDAG